MTTWEELSFLAPPDEVGDWRMAVLVNAAVEAGILAELPSSASEVAERLALDDHAVRVVLEALAQWEVVELGSDGVWRPARRAPSPDAVAVLGHHARAIAHWSRSLPDRLHGRPPTPAGFDHRQVERMLEALTVNGRESAPAVVDACLARAPEAATVLDLGGGHGEYALEFARRGLQATVQDRAEVIETARRQGRLAEHGVTLFAGDFFALLPDTRFDIVFCAGVTYTFDARRNADLFARAREVLAPDGTFAVHTFLGGTGPQSAIFAVQMLSGSGGGDTHREDDYRRWMGEAGYRSVEAVVMARTPESLLFAQP